MHAGAALDLQMRAFSTGPLDQHAFAAFDPFQQQQQPEQQQQSYAPASFQHPPPPSYGPLDADIHASPLDATASPNMLLDAPLAPAGFRFGVTLNAPTAMVKKADEVPVTYLNKGQAYTLNIVDRAAPDPAAGPQRYRTFVRVSFEDEQQRQRPAACWQLWKEGRGTNEAHQRGGRLQAVEFADAGSVTGSDAAAFTGRARVELESASFDGFSVCWSPAPGAAAECALAVRFNFLSTDFSHSKGVKGIPVRLCAKTTVLSPQAPLAGAPSPPRELCYCRVKLFRDHGAERKLSNDVAHVKKTIEKLQTQIAQAESGVKDPRKKKRAGSSGSKQAVAAAAAAAAAARPGKVPKHRRTWSMSSASSAGGGAAGAAAVVSRSPAEEDLHQRLATMQDMFGSTRPTSVLYLPGADHDDPDLHPVHLGGGEPLDAGEMDVAEDKYRSAGPALSTTDPSTAASSASSTSGGVPVAVTSTAGQAAGDWTALDAAAPPQQHADFQSNPQHLASPPDQASKQQPQQPRPSQAGDSGSLSTWIEALGVDASYKPPRDSRGPKPCESAKPQLRPSLTCPVACFYVLPKNAGSAADRGCHRAVYLTRRTAQDLTTGIAGKVGLDPARVHRVVHLTDKGLKVIVDDDVVQQLPEGQDMTMELYEVDAAGDVVAIKSEVGDDGNAAAAATAAVVDTGTARFEVKLTF